EPRTPLRLLFDCLASHRNISSRRRVQAPAMPARIAFALVFASLAAPATARAATADLSVVMSGPQFAVVDTHTSYAVTIVHSGPSAATNVVLSDAIPAAARLVSTAGDGTCATGATLRCTIATIPQDDSASVTIVLAAASAGVRLHHAVTITATTTDPTPNDH